MKFNTEKPRPLIPTGEHILKFVEVREQETTDRYGKSDTGKIMRNIWQFVSAKMDENGVPYEYPVFTGNTYGNPKANMTGFMDMIVPGMTKEKFDDFDSDTLIGKKFRAQIKHVKKEDGSGMKATHVYIMPVDSKARPAEARSEARPDTSEENDLSDPFADS